MYGADIFSILVTISTISFKNWSDDEHQLFLEGLKVHGRNYRKVSEVVKTKTYE